MKPILFALLILLPVLSHSGTQPTLTLSSAVNNAGQLRYLSERIAKAYFLVQLDIQPQRAQEQLDTSLSYMSSRLASLSALSQSLENNQALLSQLKAIKSTLHDIDKQLARDFNKDSVHTIMVLTNLGVDQSDKLTKLFEQRAGRTAAMLINVSGRQRMLSQRIAKLHSALSLKSDDTHLLQWLKESIVAFDKGLFTLQNSPLNTAYLRHKLKRVATQWRFSKEGLNLINEGVSTPLVVSLTTEKILEQMIDITSLYEALDQKGEQLSRNTNARRINVYTEGQTGS